MAASSTSNPAPADDSDDDIVMGEKLSLDEVIEVENCLANSQIWLSSVTGYVPGCVQAVPRSSLTPPSVCENSSGHSTLSLTSFGPYYDYVFL